MWLIKNLIIEWQELYFRFFTTPTLKFKFRIAGLAVAVVNIWLGAVNVWAETGVLTEYLLAANDIL
jgi:hypothetical protein